MITRKSRHEISLMQTAGKIVSEVLHELSSVIKPGVSTAELDRIAEALILKNKGYPTFKGYNGFPATICASVNNEVVHGIPSDKVILKDGDIISIDVGVTYKGLVGDSAITCPVGNITDELKTLLDVTRQALYDSITKALVGSHLEEVSAAIEAKGNEYGFGIVRNYGGHGVGRSMHEAPFVYNFKTGDPGPVLKSGMTIAIEPMFNLGTDEVYTLDDDWTVVTKDGLPSAHFEHTILITDDGPKILTECEKSV